jgi:3-isopropylmalate/(R)-2-methylmalate dehydratase small subunit
MEMHNKPSLVSKVVLRLGDDVSTDAIYPGRFMATVLPGETPRYAFADYADFNARLRDGRISPGSVIRAGSNFGCGSSREQAASALKGYDLIFLQNAVNLGLRTFICPKLEAGEGDEVEISAESVLNRTTGVRYALQPLPAARRAIIEAGGLIPYTRERLLRKQS